MSDTTLPVVEQFDTLKSFRSSVPQEVQLKSRRYVLRNDMGIEGLYLIVHHGNVAYVVHVHGLVAPGDLLDIFIVNTGESEGKFENLYEWRVLKGGPEVGLFQRKMEQGHKIWEM